MLYFQIMLMKNICIKHVWNIHKGLEYIVIGIANNQRQFKKLSYFRYIEANI